MRVILEDAVGGERDVYNGALTHSAANREAATMQAHKRNGERQPETQALIAPRETLIALPERFERECDTVLGHAGPTVSDFDQKASVQSAISFHRDQAVDRREFHGVR